MYMYVQLLAVLLVVAYMFACSKLKVLIESLLVALKNEEYTCISYRKCACDFTLLERGIYKSMLFVPRNTCLFCPTGLSNAN